MAKPDCEQHFVLLHERRASYRNSARYFLPSSFHAYHHIALDSDQDIARLARILTGNSIALVLGGGGARGFAHIGAIRAIREAGIQIDLVGGTSMGASIGAQCALGWDYDAMIERNREIWIRARPLTDYTLPLVSMISGKRYVRALRETYSDLRIEDLPLNYYCVSSDLVYGDAVVHRQGLLGRYIRASTSVGGIAPPVPDQGRLLVDGGVLNNLPVDVMRTLHKGKTLAIDVNPYGYGMTLACSDYGESLSGWKVLWSRLNPFGSRIRAPSLHAVLDRLTMLGGIHQANDTRNGLADLYIRPPTDDYGLMDMKKIATIADVGYRFTQIEIKAWLDDARAHSASV
jgi:NTE family protein/lysophospholipid hydrolase